MPKYCSYFKIIVEFKFLSIFWGMKGRAINIIFISCCCYKVIAVIVSWASFQHHKFCLKLRQKLLQTIKWYFKINNETIFSKYFQNKSINSFFWNRIIHSLHKLRLTHQLKHTKTSIPITLSNHTVNRYVFIYNIYTLNKLSLHWFNLLGKLKSLEIHYYITILQYYNKNILKSNHSIKAETKVNLCNIKRLNKMAKVFRILFVVLHQLFMLIFWRIVEITESENRCRLLWWL